MMEEREKNPLLYVSGDLRIAHHIQNGSTSRNSQLDMTMDAPFFKIG